MGILKISFAIMLQFESPELIVIGSVGIVILMSGVAATHLKVKSDLRNILPSITMLIIGLIILWHSTQISLESTANNSVQVYFLLFNINLY